MRWQGHATFCCHRGGQDEGPSIWSASQNTRVFNLLPKALCLLMGWDWFVPLDNSRAAEAKALNEDLILWPPLLEKDCNRIFHTWVFNSPITLHFFLNAGGDACSLRSQ
ncbi:hypothetical protein MUK42_14704 [Musa troglodytarum]|uniref:Uncharacterized protein n=1 Tax=Musa troglodytarum TaxID=320322 RepID=A0A9E7IAI2_9LILI|nr:hypothetical protein MUK42_14704 [Musa troglodytarum]